jgi:hypothetical protein
VYRVSLRYLEYFSSYCPYYFMRTHFCCKLCTHYSNPISLGNSTPFAKIYVLTLKTHSFWQFKSVTCRIQATFKNFEKYTYFWCAQYSIPISLGIPLYLSKFMHSHKKLIYFDNVIVLCQIQVIFKNLTQPYLTQLNPT